MERKGRAILNEVERRKDGGESETLSLGVSELDGMSMLEGLKGPLCVRMRVCVCMHVIMMVSERGRDSWQGLEKCGFHMRLSLIHRPQTA